MKCILTGVWRSPYLKMKKVSWLFGVWLFGFKDSWFLGFLVSWFQSFLVSWFQRFNIPSMLLKDITTFPCHVFDRHWSHIQDFQDFRRILIIFGASLFKTCNIWVSNISKFRTHNIFERLGDVFLILFRCPGVSKDKKSWFWEGRTRSKVPKS